MNAFARCIADKEISRKAQMFATRCKRPRTALMRLQERPSASELSVPLSERERRDLLIQQYNCKFLSARATLGSIH